MATNGHDNGNGLKQQVEAQREVVRRTAAALEDRLREKSHEVSEAIDSARDKVHEVSEKVQVVGETVQDAKAFVHQHAYAVIGGSLVAGVLLGLRRSASRGRGRDGHDLDHAIRYVIAERPKTSVFKSLLGAAAALAMRQGMSYVSRKLQVEDEEPGERYPLPSDRQPYLR